MIIKVKKVYYCEFCKKRYLSASHCSVHEKHCTANPDRKCRLCERDSIEDLIEKYSNAYETKEISDEFGCHLLKVEWLKKISLNDIRDDVEGCPNCILTILRICKLNIFPIDGFHFEYKKELEEWWSIKNDYEREMDERSSYY